MKRRKWYIGILILCLFLFAVGMNHYFSSEEYIRDRDRYPYCFNSYIGFDLAISPDFSLEDMTGRNEVAIYGEFTGERERVQATLYPDENSWLYYGYCNMAEMKGVSVEETVSEMGYEKLLFRIDGVIEDGLEREYQKDDMVEVYVYSGVNTVGYLPKIKENSKFVLFLNGYQKDGVAVYEWNATDCFYITPWNKVYSYKDTEELNSYNGKSVRYLSKAIKEIVREREE